MILEYNLQFFAKDGPGGEKTEPATQKKLDDARKEGQVAKSKEITNGVSLLALFLLLKFWIGHMGVSFMELFGINYNRIPEMVTLLEGTRPTRGLAFMCREAVWDLALIILPILLLGYAVAFVGDLVQVRWKPTTKPLQPKFSKLNPVNGFKKIFSANSLVELLKAIIKIFIIGYIAYSFLKDKWNQLFLLYDMSVMDSLKLIGKTVTDLGIRISLVYMLFAFGDFAYQKWKFSEDMKMTKQEVKDEYKNQEGDPQIKGKIRQRMQEASRRRMMQSLPEADVVITNPTHYAVAIKYDSTQYTAPIVLAKGQDYMAQKIKEIAREHEIEIVENKPLARMLYANVEIGEMVPPELYQAVAEVLAMVYHMQKGSGGR